MGAKRKDRPSPDLDRLTVAQAAVALDISQDAVRKRIARGTIPHDRDDSGRVYVYLAPSETVHKTDQDTTQDDTTKTVQDTYIRSLEDQITFLRRELERKDGILLNLTERIPQLEAPSEARESPETVEEEPEEARPLSATEGAQESTERPQQRSGWLAPVDKLPWWHYVVGIIAVFLASFFPPTAIFRGDNRLPTLAVYVILYGAAWAVTGAFGFWVGFRPRIMRFWPQIFSIGAVVGAVAGLGVIAYLVGVQDMPVTVLMYQVAIQGLVGLYALPAWLLFVSASLLGNTWQRRRIGRISGTTPASPVSRTRQGAGQQPRKDLTPAQQAMLGWGGTIISALITLVGTIIAVRSGP